MDRFSRKLSLATISKVSVTPRGEVRLHPGNVRDVSLFLTPKKATELGLALLSASQQGLNLREEAAMSTPNQ